MAMRLPLAAGSETLRLMVTANNYLGASERGPRPARQAARADALRRSFAAVVEGALETSAALVIGAGNLFATPDPPAAEREFVATALGRLQGAGIPFVAVPGAREAPGTPGAFPAGLAGIDALTVLANPSSLATARYEWEDVTVAVSGAGPMAGDLPKGLDRHLAAALRILVVPDPLAERGGTGPVLAEDSLHRLTGVALVISGGVIPDLVQLPNVTVVTAGVTEFPAFDEIAGEPGYWVLDLDRFGNVRAAVRRRVPYQPRRVVAVAAEELSGDPAAVLRERVFPLCTPDAWVRLRLTGAIDRDRYAALDLPGLVTAAEERAFAFEVVVDTDTAASDPLPAGGSLSLRAAIERAADELAATTPDPRWTAARDRILADLAASD